MHEIDKTTKLNITIDINDRKYLDEIKSHTKYKIEYIKEYVRVWLNVAVKNKDCIEFIDGMCNGGIYFNNELTTSLEVIQWFNIYAKNNKTKTFNIYLNDNNNNRIRIYKRIIQNNKTMFNNNLHIYFDNIDIIDFLNKRKKAYGTNQYNNAMTLLYVDPYNFGIHNLILTLRDFVKDVYCELIYNFFSSDIKRNVANDSAIEKQQKIISEIKGFIPYYDPNEMSSYEVMIKLQDLIKTTTNIKYSFAYQFRNEKNAELYYIMFFTPNIRGLELLKETIWKVFEGDDNYYVKKRKEDHKVKDLFGKNILDYNIEFYSNLAIMEIKKRYSINDISYSQINQVVLEKTILKNSHIIKYIIKPLILDGKILKLNKNGSKNYCNDIYRWVKKND